MNQGRNLIGPHGSIFIFTLCLSTTLSTFKAVSMNCTPSDNLNLLVLCPVCGLRKALAAFIDHLTSSLVMCCNDCRSQRAQCEDWWWMA